LINLIDNYSLVELFPLDASNEDSVNAVLYHADSILQYYENQEPREDYYHNAESAYNDNNDNEFDGEYRDNDGMNYYNMK
jgi:hypothetical protein